MVRRFHCAMAGEFTHPDGRYVSYEDHAAEIAAKDAEIADHEDTLNRIGQRIGCGHLSDLATCVIEFIDGKDAEIARLRKQLADAGLLIELFEPDPVSNGQVPASIPTMFEPNGDAING
jgi:hypothetical protein